MKNIITEELGYMKYLFGYQRGVVISEQTKPMSKKEKNVQAAYQLMIDGATSYIWGSEAKIVYGIEMINDKTELHRLFTLFKDKRTGYDTFGKMIKGEFERSDQRELNYLIKKLNKLGFSDYKTNTLPANFKELNFTPITKPLTDAQPAAAPVTKPKAEIKEHWEDVVKYYKDNKDPNWSFVKREDYETDTYIWDRIEVKSTDTNDSDSLMRVICDGDVWFWYKGRGTSSSKGWWEWDGTKPKVKFHDPTKNASGYVQPTDKDWSAVYDDNKVIGLNAKGPLVKDVQQSLILIGYSGNTGNPITKDIQGCLDNPENCDGVYGKSTKEMVKQFQKDNDLAVDGVVGKQTYYAFNDL